MITFLFHIGSSQFCITSFLSDLFYILSKMKTEMENKIRKIRTLTLLLWLITYKRVGTIFYVSFYIPKFKGNYWLMPCKIYLNIYSEAHFFLLDFVWYIYNGYVQTYGISLYLNELFIREYHMNTIVYCQSLLSNKKNFL